MNGSLEATVLAGAKAQLGRVAAIAAGLAAALAVGFAGGVLFEHRPQAGFPLSMLGRSLAVQRDAAKALAAANAANWRGMKDNRDAWIRAHGQCEAARRASLAPVAAGVRADYARARAAADAAFAGGYRAGRIAGALTCGDNDHATADGVRAPGGDDLDGELHPLGEDDFAARWAGAAYRPGGAVRP